MRAVAPGGAQARRSVTWGRGAAFPLPLQRADAADRPLYRTLVSECLSDRYRDRRRRPQAGSVTQAQRRHRARPPARAERSCRVVADLISHEAPENPPALWGARVSSACFAAPRLRLAPAAVAPPGGTAAGKQAPNAPAGSLRKKRIPQPSRAGVSGLINPRG